MSTENPYAAPETGNTLAPTGDPQFGDLDDKQFKKLYYRSCNVSAITALLALGLFIIIGLITLPSEGGASLKKMLFGGLAVFYIIALIGLFKRTSWGRIMGIIVCVIALINIPVGTIIGIVGLFAFIAAPNLFGADRVLHKDLKAEFKLRKRLRKLR